jgi:hypothetical protein
MNRSTGIDEGEENAQPRGGPGETAGAVNEGMRRSRTIARPLLPLA